MPKGATASHLIQAVRAKYFKDKKEAEFMVVCDTLKESSHLINDIHEAQVNIAKF